MRITIISGSPRGNSVTHRIALYLQSALRRRSEAETAIIDLKETDFPLLQAVFTSVDNTPAPYKAVSEIMFSTDAFILLTPEYNGSYSAPLKNLLDHYPKQHRKVFAIATASTGALGGVRAAMQLQELVYALFGIGSPYMLVTPFADKKFDAQGNLLDPAFQKSIDVFLNEFLWLAERIGFRENSMEYKTKS